MGETRRSYDALADAYAREVGGELAGKPLDRALLGVLADAAGDGLVLDAGSGPGHVAAHLAAAGARVLALDLAPRMLRAAPVPAVAGDLTALPLRTGSVAAAVCWYAVIHLDDDARAAAYRELARVLVPGGLLSLAFHVADAGHGPGDVLRPDRMWDVPVRLDFRFLDPQAETAALAAAGLVVTSRLDRDAYPGVEHASSRAYLTATRRRTAPRP